MPTMVTKGPLSLSGKDRIVKGIGEDLTSFDGRGESGRIRLVVVVWQIPSDVFVESFNHRLREWAAILKSHHPDGLQADVEITITLDQSGEADYFICLGYIGS